MATVEPVQEFESVPQNQVLDDSGWTSGSDLPNGAGTQTGTSTPDPSKPGTRQKNPLANYASYTYNLSLFMITPDAYDAFVQSGRKTPYALQRATDNSKLSSTTVGGAGCYLVAQSGGINNKTSKRAPGFDLDYYIDDLKMTNKLGGHDTGAMIANTELTFKIYEPYGFSFITNLQSTAAALSNYMKAKGGLLPENGTKQFFILGICFTGWDALGNISQGEKQAGADIDHPAADNTSIFERYFDIEIVKVEFKIDGKMTVYNITAKCTAQNAIFGTKRGMLPTLSPINGDTVKNMLDGPNGLLTKLNNEQKKLWEAGSITYTNNYSVKFLGEGSSEIEQALMMSPADLDKTRSLSSKAEKTSEVTPAAEKKLTPTNKILQLTFAAGEPITQAITQIIKNSSFLTDALTVLGTTELENNIKTKTEELIKSKTKRTLKWFSLGVDVSHANWDPKTKDFAYDITYIIRPYETPAVVSMYSTNVMQYYGAHKRYDYWYTGKNSEIIQYEMVVNNGYFNVVLGSAMADKAIQTTDWSNNIPFVPGLPPPGDKSGRIASGSDVQNQYVTNLNDPANFAGAKLTIYGDPDYLMPNLPGDVNEVYQKFYDKDNYTINPNSGQVFIEINFYEAQDYDTAKTGLLKINEKMLFWKYPANVQKELDARGGGISHMVQSVTHSLSGGKFTQTLECTINDFRHVPKEEPVTATTPDSVRVPTVTQSVALPEPYVDVFTAEAADTSQTLKAADDAALAATGYYDS